MRTLSTLLAAIALASSPALAGNECDQPNAHSLSAEDCSIMASVRPQAAQPVAARPLPEEGLTVLYSLPDPYGRMTENDLSQIRSVQPTGRKLVLCTTARTL